MAPSYFATGVMVYLAPAAPRRVMRGLVGSFQPAFHLQTANNAASKHSLETAFFFGSDTCLPVTSPLKSFPSEKTKRGHYV